MEISRVEISRVLRNREDDYWYQFLVTINTVKAADKLKTSSHSIFSSDVFHLIIILKFPKKNTDRKNLR